LKLLSHLFSPAGWIAQGGLRRLVHVGLSAQGCPRNTILSYEPLH
jgi:hypothetical protein